MVRQGITPGLGIRGGCLLAYGETEAQSPLRGKIPQVTVIDSKALVVKEFGQRGLKDVELSIPQPATSWDSSHRDTATPWHWRLLLCC